MDNTSGGEPPKRRSVSLTGTRNSQEHYSSSGSEVSPGLISELNLVRFPSNPELSVQTAGYLDTPLGQGLGTRWSSRRNEGTKTKLEKTLSQVEALRVEIDNWAKQSTWEGHPALERILEEYDGFKTRTKALARDALLRGASMKQSNDIEAINSRLDGIKRLVERKSRNSGANIATRNSGNLIEPQDELVDEVFQPTPHPNDKPSESTPNQSPRNSGEEQGNLSQSIENISLFIRNARVDVDQLSSPEARERAVSQIISTVRAVGSTSIQRESLLDREQEIRDKVIKDSIEKQNSQIQAIETLCKSIQESVHELRTAVTTIETQVKSLESQSNENNEKVSSLETKVNLIDRNTKSYIGKRVSHLKDKVVTEIKANQGDQVTSEIKSLVAEEINKTTPGKAIQEVRAEIEKIKEHNKYEEQTIMTLRDIVVEVKNQVDLTQSVLPSSRASTPAPSLNSTQSNQECEIIKASIERSVRLIRQLTSTTLTPNSDITLIKKCNKEDTKKVVGYAKSCGEDLLRYVKYPSADPQVCNTVREVLNEADEWVLEVETLYAQREAHAVSDAKGDISNLKIFSDNTHKTIFEFLEEIDMALLGWGTSKQRAHILGKLLSEDIKSKIIDFSDNFSAIRKWLITKYGGADRVVGDILEGVKQIQKPSPTSKKERYAFYADLTCALSRLDKLSKVPGIDLNNLATTLYSRNTLYALIELLPEKDRNKVRSKLTDNNIDWSNPTGVRTFSIYKTACESERNLLEPYRGLDSIPAKSKGRAVFMGNVRSESSDSSGDDDPAVHAASWNPPPPWFPPGMRFPCPLETHNHEMADCKTWLSLTPSERWDKSKTRRICYCCLKPKSVCNERKCIFMKSVPDTLVCHGCKKYAKDNNFAPFNIMLCRKVNHGQGRARFDDIKKTLEKYLGKLSSEVNETNLSISAHISYQVYSAGPPQSQGDSEMITKVNKTTPCIDSHSGARRFPGKKLVLPESKEHAFYLMQILRIGTSDILTFFDGGANSNLISGDIAVKERLEKTSEKETTIKTLGGGSICTRYGNYRFSLGPTEENEFAEINCIGMDELTTEFRKYSLEEISQEYRNSCKEGKPEPVPKYTGGGKVGLLLGLKNPRLHPVLIKTLDSGVAVYKSPFKDIFGSRIIFAGPHKAFTKGNKNITNEVSLAIHHMATAEEETWSNKYEVPYEIKADNLSGATLNPTPLTREDFIQSGIEPNKSIPGESAAKPSGLEAHMCSVHQAWVPLAKMRELLNLDNENLVTYRCQDCSQCIKCKKSPRLQAISLVEAREQDAIEASVNLDLEKKKVTVKLPFMFNPVPSLKKKHGANSNYKQANHIYRAQCKKPDKMKEGMRKAHQELVEKGFMIKLETMSPADQCSIKNAEFQHYHPWNIVENENSLSTPMRMCVDPTVTGLNQTLAKGENRMGQIPDIMIRSRIKKYGWVSDVSKLYNQLELEKSAHPYSLFLYHESLDPNTKPEEWVMLRAWYGVTPTGSQAGYALDQLAELGAEEYPEAKQAIQRDRYVDDISSGASTEKERDIQILQVQKLLEKGGFSLKYVIKSGETPDPKATEDGITTKMLGYKWSTVQDELKPGITELNLNKRVRGARKPNVNPVITTEDAEKLLKPVLLTRRHIISKIAEFYDPIGVWEPIKLQLKLQSVELNGKDWDEILGEEEQKKWKEKLVEFVTYKELTVNRCCVPSDEMSNSKIRLLGMADAAEGAGGAAVYVGRKLVDGTWSCSLMASKSKLMKDTIPRNELSAILVLAELMYVVKKALGDDAGELIYTTDSTIALSWCHNTAKKLRAFVFTRVESIRRLIQWTTNTDEIPLYHIEGAQNLADLLTKEHEIKVENVSKGSEWQDGLPWMKIDLEKMNLISYENLSVEKKLQEKIQEECFQEPFLPETEEISINHTQDTTNIFPSPGKGGESRLNLVIDPIRVGWLKTQNTLCRVFEWIDKLKHKTQHKTIKPNCQLCEGQGEYDWKENQDRVRNHILQQETIQVKLSVNPKKLKKFYEKEGILHFKNRIVKENQDKPKDLDNLKFIDKHKIVGDLPVVRVNSPLVYSLVMYIHCQTAAHAGIETTVREVFKEFFVEGGLRQIIRKIKTNCITCKLLKKETIEVEMSPHPPARTTLAPPFWSSMVDIAYGFSGQSYKKSRTRVKIYALVVVCILSGATDILAMEGAETQDVVAAIERHASRYGVPGEMYIDSGSQLKALEHASFSIRDLEHQVYKSQGIKLKVSNAKAHEERGRVERKIRTIRETLSRLGIKSSNPMTALQWESVFWKIASTIDNLPLARSTNTSASKTSYEIITANRLKIGRNNSRNLEGAGFRLALSQDVGRILERNREIYQDWYRIFMENIHELMIKPNKWDIAGELPKVGDIVTFVMNDSGYGKEGTTWKLGEVVKTEPRKISISYVSKVSISGKSTKGEVTRNPRDVSILFTTNELFNNTKEHFEEITSQK